MHKNYIISSNLIFVSLALGVVNSILSGDLTSSGQQKTMAIVSLLFVGWLGHLVRRGIAWIKYLLLVLALIGLLAFSFVLPILFTNPIAGVISVGQAILQLIALVLLFRIPRQQVTATN